MTFTQLIFWWVIILLLWILQKPLVGSIQKIVKKSFYPTVYIVYLCVLGVITLSIVVFTLQKLNLDRFLHFFLFLILLLAFFTFMYAKDLFLCLAGWLYVYLNEAQINDKEVEFHNKFYKVKSIRWLSSELVDREDKEIIVPNKIFLESVFKKQ